MCCADLSESMLLDTPSPDQVFGLCIEEIDNNGANCEVSNGSVDSPKPPKPRQRQPPPNSHRSTCSESGGLG